jgi:hypothetical protein
MTCTRPLPHPRRAVGHPQTVRLGRHQRVSLAADPPPALTWAIRGAALMADVPFAVAEPGTTGRIIALTAARDTRAW